MGEGELSTWVEPTTCRGKVTEGLEGCEVLNNASFRIYQLQSVYQKMHVHGLNICCVCVERSPPSSFIR